MDKVERVARAMAVADGFDPDGKSQGGPNDFATQACDFNGYAMGVYGLTWQTYARRANLFIAATEAVTA